MDYTKLHLNTFIPILPYILNDNFKKVNSFINVFYDEKNKYIKSPINTSGIIKGSKAEFNTLVVDNIIVKNKTNIFDDQVDILNDKDFVNNLFTDAASFGSITNNICNINIDRYYYNISNFNYDYKFYTNKIGTEIIVSLNNTNNIAKIYLNNNEYLELTLNYNLNFLIPYIKLICTDIIDNIPIWSVIDYSSGILSILKTSDLDILRQIRDANPSSQLPSLWLDTEDPYTQWEGVTWNESNTSCVELNISYRNISTLNNINKLSSLTYLDCDGNLLTELNLSGLNNLNFLTCGNNSLSNLDLSGLISLNSAFCHYNKLTSLTLNNLDNLNNLSCSYNLLSNLDLRNLNNLIGLNCAFNQLNTLNISSLTNLQYLTCNNNILATLDISTLNNLQSLVCNNNELTTLDVSTLINLNYLNCNNNYLQSLNVIGLNNLNLLDCGNNFLQGLDVSNLTALQTLICNNNDLFNLSSLISKYNINTFNCTFNYMSSLETDRLVNLGFTNAQVLPQKKTDLDILRQIRDANPSSQLPILWSDSADPYTSWSGVVWDAQHIHITILDLINLNILNLDGINNLAYLQSLNCSNNGLTSLNVSNMKSLTWFSCAINQITKLDLENTNNLYTLICSNNVLEELDLLYKTKIQMLQCSNNKLQTLDVSYCKLLNILYCGNNNLIELDLSNNSSLVQFQCIFNKISSLNLSNVNNLQYISIYFNNLISLPTLTSKGNINDYNFTYNYFTLEELDRLRTLGFNDESKLVPQHVIQEPR